MADVSGKFFSAKKVRTGVSPSSPGVEQGETLPPVNPPGTSLNSVGLTMPSAFSVANSPLTSNGTIAVTGAGTTDQYIRGDGSLQNFPSLTGYVPYTGATADVDLGTHDLTAERGTFANNGSSDTLTVNHTSGSGIGVKVTKGGNGEALLVTKTSGSGNAMAVVGGRTALVDLSLSSVSNATGNFLTISGGVVHQRTPSETRSDVGAQAQLNGTGFVKASGTTITYDNSIYQVTSEKGQPNGYASLDGNGKVPLAQINDALIGNVNYQGLWNAATNTPTLANPPASGTKGYYYIVSTAGTFAGISFEVGDWIISNGSAWQKVDNTDAVSSVFGRTGNVIAANGDYNTSQVTENTNLYYTEARVSANTDVAANTAARHNAVTLGTANGLSLSTQQLSLQLATSGQNGALSSTDWTTFNSKENAITAGTTAQYFRGDKTFQTLNTAAVPESGNLYFTNARAIASTLTGYTSGAGTISAADSILSAIQKLNGNIGSLVTGVSSVFGRTGSVIAANGDYYLGTTPIQAASANQGLTGITGITFVAHVNDSASITTTISGTSTFFDFNLSDDNLNDEWRWRFTPSGASVYNAMRLVPTTNTTSDLIVSGAISGSNLSGTNTGNVTLGTANGLGLSGQQLSLGLASAGVTGALSGTDWSTFNSKQQALNGTGFVKISGTTISYDNSTYLTGNQTITLSGDATGSGATAITVVLANSGVTAGTYNDSATQVRPFTVDAKGRITSIGTAVTITPDWANISGQRTLTRDDAGLQGNAGARSGFFETVSPVNYYSGANSWQHLIESRHTNDSNNYAMQIAGSFFDQEFYVRKTNNSATTAWSKLWHSGNLTPVTGTGTSGQVAFFNGTSSITGESNLFWDSTNDRLGVGTASPGYRLDLLASSAADSDIFRAGMSGVSNGFTIQRVSSNLRYTFLDGNITIENFASPRVFVTGNGATGFPGFNLSNTTQGYEIIVRGNISNTFQIRNTTASTDLVTITPSGNLGLGVTPSAWGAFKAIEVGTLGNSFWGLGINSVQLSSNYYFDGAYRYANNGFANRYDIGSSGGQHIWFNAPSGTAGNAITFTQAMTLGSNSGLSIGTPSAAPAQGLLVQGNAIINGTVIGTDQTFGGAYRTFAFGTNSNGFNRIFAANDQSDGIYINAATGRGIYFRVNGGGSNVFSVESTGAATFSGSVTTSFGQFLAQPSTGTNSAFSGYLNDGGQLYVGIDNSAGSSFGRGAYAYNFFGNANRPMVFSTDGVTRLTIAGTGAATFSSDVTIGASSQLYLTSGDLRYSSNAGFGIVSQNGTRLVSIQNGAFGVTGAATFSSSVTAGSFVPTSSTVPTNGMYLDSANTIAFSTNSSQKLILTSVGDILFRGQETGDLSGARIINNSNALAFYASNLTSGPAKSISFYGRYLADELRMRISVNGNVLIGTDTDTSDKLRVGGNTFTNTITTYRPGVNTIKSDAWKLGRASAGTQPTEDHQITVQIGDDLYAIGAVKL
jgi:hypothetical protein